MTILDNAKAHFRDKMGGTLRSVSVPEWTNGEAEPVRIYFKPSMTLRDQGEIIELSQNGKTAEGLAMTLFNRALDENGKRLFVKANMTELMRMVDPDVIAAVCTAMSVDDDMTDEDLEKN